MLKFAHNFRAVDVVDALNEQFLVRGVPEHIRSDNCAEFAGKDVEACLNALIVKSLFVEPGSPRENGYVESFHGLLRDELLRRELFTTLLEARVMVEDWRREYNMVCPHSALNYRPPAPVALILTSCLAL